MSENLKAQRHKIMQHIRKHGNMTTVDARNMGIMHPAARIMELRKQGLNIATNMMEQVDSAGEKHCAGVYTLDGGLV